MYYTKILPGNKLNWSTKLCCEPKTHSSCTSNIWYQTMDMLLPGYSLAIVCARAGLLPPTLFSTASTSLLQVGFLNLSTWETIVEGGMGQRREYLYTCTISTNSLHKTGETTSQSCPHNYFRLISSPWMLFSCRQWFYLKDSSAMFIVLDNSGPENEILTLKENCVLTYVASCIINCFHTWTKAFRQLWYKWFHEHRLKV